MAVTLENVDVIKSTSGKELVVDDGLGGIGSHDFIATGSIGAGQTVGLRSDGTVEVITDGIETLTNSVGTRAVFNSAAISYSSTVFDPNANKVVIVYDHGHSLSGKAVVGTVSGTSITFGTPSVFNSARVRDISAIFDTNSNKVVIAYTDEGNSYYGTAIVGTVSGNSITFGTPSVFNSATTYGSSATFDSNSNKVVIAYADAGNSYYGKAVVCTVSGTSITFGTPVYLGGKSGESISATFDSNSNKVVIVYNDGNYGAKAVVGTVSGTSISFGSPEDFLADARYISATFDSNSNKVVIAYMDAGSSNSGRAAVGTVSGNSISFGPRIEFERATYISATFDSNTNTVVIAYTDTSGYPHYGTAVVGTVSGTSITFGTPVVFGSAGTSANTATFDSNTNKVVIAYRDQNDNASWGVAFQAEGTAITTNADTWIGIAEESVNSSEAVSIKTVGGVVSGLSGLTIGSEYYVNYDGTLVATENAGVNNGTYGKIGKAISSSKLLITETN